MKNFSLRQLTIAGIIFACLAGTINHFVYAWTEFLPLALISPTNESVWEHLKILITPILIFLIVEWFASKDKQRLLAAKFRQVVFGIIFMIAFFYTYSGIIGEEVLWIDIASFYITVILSYIVSYRAAARKLAPKFPAAVYAIGISVIVLCLWVTTFYPPEIPLFYDASVGQYGLGD